MKALVCEMCNSHDLVKQDGNYVCQSCGTKYSLEEAKKMMVEIECAVKIDNTDIVAKYLANARRAKQKQDWEETEKYYNLVEQNEPSNIEAIFYSAYGKARTTLPVNDYYKREAVFKAFVNSISIIDDNYDVTKSDILHPIIKQIVTDSVNLMAVSFVYTETKNGYGVVTGSDKSKTYQLFINVIANLFDTLTDIIRKIPQANNDKKVFIFEQQLRLMYCLMNDNDVDPTVRGRFINIYVQTAESLCRISSAHKMDTYTKTAAEARKALKSTKIKKVFKFIGICVGALLIGLAYGYYVFWI